MRRFCVIAPIAFVGGMGGWCCGAPYSWCDWIVSVLYSTMDNILIDVITIIVWVLLHVYYACILVKTGEYLASFLAFADLQILFCVGQIMPTRVSIICPTKNRIYKSTNRNIVIFWFLFVQLSKEITFFATNTLKMVWKKRLSPSYISSFVGDLLRVITRIE
jgi:hypothetical protein